MMESKKNGLKTEILIISIAALVALALTAAVMIITRSGGGKTAVITLRGEEIERIELQNVAEPYEIRITDGCDMTVDVERGRIRVRESSCPDKICVDFGWLSESGDTAVCLPNRVTVRVE